MDKSIFAVRRKNYIAVGEMLFWTTTIKKWQRLLWKKEYKHVIINCVFIIIKYDKPYVFSYR
jgi:putative transposase